MLPLLKRHAIHVLVTAGHTYVDVARFVGVNERTVRRVAREAPVTQLEDIVSPQRVGRPSTAEPYRQLITNVLGEEPMLLSVEILRRARLEGYAGGKTALYV
jgi:transposase